MINIQPSLLKHPFTYIDENNVKKEFSSKDKALTIVVTALSSLIVGPFAIFIFYGIAKHLRDRKISFLKTDEGTPVKAKKIWQTTQKEKNTSPYIQRLEKFKKFCKEKNIDTQNRRQALYRFFTDEKFIYSAEIDKHYDFSIEDVFTVFFMTPKEDEAFLKYLHATYPKELQTIYQSAETKNYLKLDQVTRFANSDTYMFIHLYKNNPAVLKMLKDVLLYCILKYNVVNERVF